MSVLERLIGALLTPNILTYIITSYVGVVMFFLKSFDKRIRALEKGKVDTEDLVSVRELMQQMIKTQDKRADRIEDLLQKLASWEPSPTEPDISSLELSKVSNVVETLAKEVDKSNRLLENHLSKYEV